MITFNNKVVTYNHKWINGNGSPYPITSYNYQVDWIWNLTEEENTYNVNYYSSQLNLTPFRYPTSEPGYTYIYLPPNDEWSEQDGGVGRMYSSSQFVNGYVMKFVYRWPLDTPANRRVIQINFTNISSWDDIPANKFTMRVTDLNTSQVITSWNNPLIERNRMAQCLIILSNYE